MNEIKVFSHKELGGVRVLEINGQPWFIGKDVANILGYENGSRDIKRHVDEEDRRTEMLPQYQNGTLVSKALIINESGLYSLILSSKLPKAREFKRWVTSEVLPSIRKTGGYVAGNETDYIIKAATQATMQTVMEQLPMIISQTVQSTLAGVLINSEHNKTVAEKPKKRRINYHGKIDHLPTDLRNEIMLMIYQKKYTYLKVSNYLKDKGYDINQSSVFRYVKRYHDSLADFRDIDIEEV